LVDGPSSLAPCSREAADLSQVLPFRQEVNCEEGVCAQAHDNADRFPNPKGDKRLLCFLGNFGVSDLHSSIIGQTGRTGHRKPAIRVHFAVRFRSEHQLTSGWPMWVTGDSDDTQRVQPQRHRGHRENLIKPLCPLCLCGSNRSPEALVHQVTLACQPGRR
jgi:hypothetical protein